MRIFNHTRNPNVPLRSRAISRLADLIAYVSMEKPARETARELAEMVGRSWRELRITPPLARPCALVIVGAIYVGEEPASEDFWVWPDGSWAPVCDADFD